jgi:hypothetical protein
MHNYKRYRLGNKKKQTGAEKESKKNLEVTKDYKEQEETRIGGESEKNDKCVLNAHDCSSCQPR